MVTASDTPKAAIILGMRLPLSCCCALVVLALSACGYEFELGDLLPGEDACFDCDGDGWPTPEDCDDTNPDVHPNMYDACDNGLDEDCDGRIGNDEARERHWRLDGDGDGYPNPNDQHQTNGCSPPQGYMTLVYGKDSDTPGLPIPVDCADSLPEVHPGAVEVCNGMDDNCDGRADEDGDTDNGLRVPFFEDLDGDGVGGYFAGLACPHEELVVVGGDCDDSDPGVGSSDPRDDDGDGWIRCEDGQVVDCDDTNENVYPGVDNDGDGWGLCLGGNKTEDCNDWEPSIHPGVDEDGDGYALCALHDQPADCDDNNPDLFPGLNSDEDGDGFVACPEDGSAPDCDDQNNDIFPGMDFDGDGFSSCPVTGAQEDCDDEDPSIHPFALDNCFNGEPNDLNCNGLISEDASPVGIVFSDGAEAEHISSMLHNIDQGAGYCPVWLDIADLQEGHHFGHFSAIIVTADTGEMGNWYGDPAPLEVALLDHQVDFLLMGEGGRALMSALGSGPDTVINTVFDYDNAFADDPDYELVDFGSSDNQLQDPRVVAAPNAATPNPEWYEPNDVTSMPGWDDDAATIYNSTLASLQAGVLASTAVSETPLALYSIALESVSDPGHLIARERSFTHGHLVYWAWHQSVGGADGPHLTESGQALFKNLVYSIADGADSYVDADPSVDVGDDDDDASGDDDDACPSEQWFIDTDGDGFGNPAVWTEDCAQPAGYVDNGEDCNDLSPEIHPGAPELCDLQDNDCDSVIDEDIPDNDGDGHDPAPCGTDCDDNDGNNFPGNTESCDGQDNDCNPGTSENEDQDGDGLSICGSSGDGTNGDCDDANANTFPGNTESCDGEDNDCNPDTSENADQDGDGYSACGSSGDGTNGDCDDSNPNNFPGNTESCDGQDNDCNDLADASSPGLPGQEVDGDGDGIAPCQGDCDDGDATNFENNTELCDGQDNDCNDMDDAGNPGVPGQEVDGDGDGLAPCQGDCDDADNNNFDDNVEFCDGQDNDCNGLDDAGNPGVPDQELDADGDGMAPCQGDCDDLNGYNFPGNPEICDGQDNDCVNGADFATTVGDGGDEIDDEDDDGSLNCADCDDDDQESNLVVDDEDCDGHSNDQDNCPSVVNVTQTDSNYDGLGDFCEDDAPAFEESACGDGIDNDGDEATDCDDVDCRQQDFGCPPADGDVRLANGTTMSEGRVELYWQGEWGSICGTSWSLLDADVVCVQLGYDGRDFLSLPGVFDPGFGSIWISGPQCSGGEAAVLDCPATMVWGDDPGACDHTDDVAVICNLEETPETDGDQDGDGIPDTAEGTTVDTDGDLTFNHLDTDSDNDNIPDQIEQTPDSDGDSSPNYLDVDSDGDGFFDVLEGLGDSDGDLQPNYLDLDSDGDGISDADEGGGLGSDVDTDGDGVWDRLDPVECVDNIDNDSDGWIDGNDPGCPAGSPTDNNEGDGSSFACSDELDNDSDGLVDAEDPGCFWGWGDTESPECNDGIDNDGDSLVDLDDTGCSDSADDSESSGP